MSSPSPSLSCSSSPSKYPRSSPSIPRPRILHRDKIDQKSDKNLSKSTSSTKDLKSSSLNSDNNNSFLMSLPYETLKLVTSTKEIINHPENTKNGIFIVLGVIYMYIYICMNLSYFYLLKNFFFII
jgi:hypothetical protein